MCDNGRQYITLLAESQAKSGGQNGGQRGFYGLKMPYLLGKTMFLDMVRDQKAEGSNPSAPTIPKVDFTQCLQGFRACRQLLTRTNFYAVLRHFTPCQVGVKVGVGKNGNLALMSP